jgi:hypothetical protein
MYVILHPIPPQVFNEPTPATTLRPASAAGLPAGLPAAPAIAVPTATTSPAVLACVWRRRRLRCVRDVSS